MITTKVSISICVFLVITLTYARPKSSSYSDPPQRLSPFSSYSDLWNSYIRDFNGYGYSQGGNRGYEPTGSSEKGSDEYQSLKPSPSSRKSFYSTFPDPRGSYSLDSDGYIGEGYEPRSPNDEGSEEYQTPKPASSLRKSFYPSFPGPTGSYSRDSDGYSQEVFKPLGPNDEGWQEYQPTPISIPVPKPKKIAIPAFPDIIQNQPSNQYMRYDQKDNQGYGNIPAETSHGHHGGKDGKK